MKDVEELQMEADWWVAHQPPHFNTPQWLARKAYIAGYAAAKAEPQWQWQWMESAPKDGSAIMIFGVPYGNYSRPEWCIGFWSRDDWHWEAGEAIAIKIKNATAWMPLPTPPEPAQ